MDHEHIELDGIGVRRDPAAQLRLGAHVLEPLFDREMPGRGYPHPRRSCVSVAPILPCEIVRCDCFLIHFYNLMGHIHKNSATAARIGATTSRSSAGAAAMPNSTRPESVLKIRPRKALKSSRTV